MSGDPAPVEFVRNGRHYRCRADLATVTRGFPSRQWSVARRDPGGSYMRLGIVTTARDATAAEIEAAAGTVIGTLERMGR